MTYEWYNEIDETDSFTQGDIIFNCPIPIMNESVYKAAISSEKKEEVTEVDSPIDVKTADIIILSQACDIKNDKIDSIVVCPVWPFTSLIKKNTYFESSKARESLRQGKEPSYHLLNEFSSNTINFHFSVVDFHRIYSLPKDYIKSILSNGQKRLRLLPPYREHLSQAFARYFMRVGLPVDISKEAIKGTSV